MGKAPLAVLQRRLGIAVVLFVLGATIRTPMALSLRVPVMLVSHSVVVLAQRVVERHVQGRYELEAD